ncbi:MAG: glycosyltransferase, partial [Gemmatimonadetes bacterium]|nr:glycosyltransferase [Gemmatimonadota bacterium]
TKKKKKTQRKRRTSGNLQLSLCLIARDEADFLDRCLASVQGLVDEVVVVDTGSRDGTKTVARRHGARLFSHTWTGDFSEARNAAIERARGQWILVLDCDEILAPRDHESLRSLLTDDSADAYRLTTRNYGNDSGRDQWHISEGTDYAVEEKSYPGWFPTTKVRLWRRQRQTRFRGTVHELVEPSLQESGQRIGDSLVPIHHYGYVEKERSSDRYVEAGERKLAQNQDDLQARYELAIAYRDAGRLAEGLEQIRHVEKGMAGQEATTSGYLEIDNVDLVHADLLDRSDRLAEALQVTSRVLLRTPDSATAHNNTGSLLTRLGRHEDALQSYRRAQQLAPDHDVIAENLAKVERHLAGVAHTPLAQDGGTKKVHKLSICLIARDCARQLDRCLKSLAGIGDEIVVVDTGSTDGTVAVAVSHGAKIGHFPWCDDYAAARNESLNLATVGDWILWLDADEFLQPEDRDKIRRAKQLTPDQALQFTLVNTEGADRTSFRQIKMFPRRDDLRFERPVHETVLDSVRRLGLPLRHTDVRVMHTGYADPETVARKSAYYRRLMEDWSADHPEDLDVCFRLGHTAYVEGEKPQAIQFFDRVLNTPAPIEPRSLERHAAVFRGRCRLETGDFVAAIPDFERALAIESGDVFAHASMGDALTKMGEYARAREHLLQALDGEIDGNFPLDTVLIEYSTRFFLGQCLAAMGDHAEAAKALAAAHELQPERSEAAAALRELRPSLAGKPLAASPKDRTSYASLESSATVTDVEQTNPDARLTLCMIVRNEEERLGNCLESAKDVVDEIVIIDTGSTDGTVDIARSYGAVLGTFEWCDDFSAARNQSLQLATGDWIMWLDADDLLPVEFHQPIRRLVAGSRDRSYFFVLDDQGYESVSCLQMRLFPNLEGIRFEMPIHEQVTPSLGRLGIDMQPTDIRVVHTGYTTPEVVHEKKRRYLGIMERWLQKHPGDYIVRSHVALTYHTTGRGEEAIAAYRHILEQSKCLADHNYVIYTTALLFLGRTYLKMEQVEDALHWIGKAYDFDPDYILSCFSMAEANLAAQKWTEAVEAARSVLNADVQMTFFPIDRQELTYSSLCVLGRALAQLDDIDGASEALHRATQTTVVRRSEALGVLSEIYKARGQADEAYKALTEALLISPDDAKHRFNRGMLDLEARRLDQAEEAFISVLAVSPGYAPALMNLGYIAKTGGDMAAAERWYLQVLEMDADNADGHANLGHLYLTLERFIEAERHLARVYAQKEDLLDIQLGLLQAQLAQGNWNAILARQALAAMTDSGTPDVSTAANAAPALLQFGVALVHRNVITCAQIAFSCAVQAAQIPGNLPGPGSGNAIILQARKCLGELFITQGQPWKAIAEYEALLQADPKDGEVFGRLGDCYTKLGVEDAARMCYDQREQLAKG